MTAPHRLTLDDLMTIRAQLLCDSLTLRHQARDYGDNHRPDLAAWSTEEASALEALADRVAMATKGQWDEGDRR